MPFAAQASIFSCGDGSHPRCHCNLTFCSFLSYLFFMTEVSKTPQTEIKLEFTHKIQFLSSSLYVCMNNKAEHAVQSYAVGSKISILGEQC